jgi:hypothetical protein
LSIATPNGGELLAGDRLLDVLGHRVDVSGERLPELEQSDRIYRMNRMGGDKIWSSHFVPVLQVFGTFSLSLRRAAKKS